jgi:hypothetical protein
LSTGLNISAFKAKNGFAILANFKPASVVGIGLP